MKPMTWGIACLALVAVTVRGGDDEKTTLDLGPGKRLVITAPKDLSVTAQPADDRVPATLRIADAEQVYRLRVILAPVAKLMPEEEMRKILVKTGNDLLVNAVEKEIVVKEMEGKESKFVYFELTDSRKEEGDGRYMIQGVGRLPGIAVQFMILSDRNVAEKKAALLAVIRNLAVEEKKAAAGKPADDMRP